MSRSNDVKPEPTAEEIERVADALQTTVRGFTTWEHAARAAILAMDRRAEAVVWHKGYPPKPWASEWFIAVTTYGDRVVLRELPEEYTYDFHTADGTYIKADRIARWAQFPDGEFIPYASPPAPAVAVHPDDAAVEIFAARMKAKLAIARKKGRGGWDDRELCPDGYLSKLLHEHVTKGDPVDVANLAMMLALRGERIERNS